MLLVWSRVKWIGSVLNARANVLLEVIEHVAWRVVHAHDERSELLGAALVRRLDQCAADAQLARRRPHELREVACAPTRTFARLLSKFSSYDCTRNTLDKQKSKVEERRAVGGRTGVENLRLARVVVFGLLRVPRAHELLGAALDGRRVAAQFAARLLRREPLARDVLACAIP